MRLPSERAKPFGSLIAGSLVTAYTERLPEVPEGAAIPVNSDLDLFFNYDVEALDVEGNPIATPHLRGTSGASVWAYREPEDMRVWSPESCLKIVGVQSSFLRGRYFRAKSWAAVMETMRQIDQKLSGVIDAHIQR